MPPFSFSGGWEHGRMGVFNRVVLCLVLLVPLIFFGTASASTITLTPISAGPIIGGVSNVRWEHVPTTGATRYGNALVPVSAASLGKMTVGAMARHPGIHLAIMAYLALHENWQWDPVGHRFVEPGEEGFEDLTGQDLPPWNLGNECDKPDGIAGPFSTGNPNSYWMSKSTGSKETPSGTFPALQQEWMDSAPGCNQSGTNSDICSVSPHIPHRSASSAWYTCQRTQLMPTGTSEQVVPDSVVGERLEQASETITNQITNNVINQNNTTIQNEWNELHLTRVNIETSFENETPDGQWTQTPGAGDTTINNTFSMDFPIFCDWAGVVCSFIEWFQETNEPPEDPDLPTEETEEVWDEWDSGMPSSGSCPAPHTTEFMGNAISIPFDDFCYGLSTYFRPIFIALALFAAGFILVGARQ